MLHPLSRRSRSKCSVKSKRQSAFVNLLVGVSVNVLVEMLLPLLLGVRLVDCDHGNRGGLGLVDGDNIVGLGRDRGGGRGRRGRGISLGDLILRLDDDRNIGGS